MKMLHKWAMMAMVAATGLSVAAPAQAEVSAEDIAVIAQTCVAIDRGDITEEDLDILDDEEYGALMAACGFAGDGVVEAPEMAAFAEYYVIFQEDVVSFETVVYEANIETEESYEELQEEFVDEEYDEADAEFDEEYEEDEAELEEADAEFEEEYDEAGAEIDGEYDEAMDESAMDEAEAEG